MSSIITIPSRCHAYPNEWDGEQNAGIPYAFNDRIEILTWREIEEVERSGRSDHRSYAETPTQWPGEQHPVAPLMEARPGKTGSVRIVIYRSGPRRGVLTSYDKRFIRSHRKRSGIAQLSAVLWVWPPVVRRYCREVWLSSVPYFSAPVYDTDELIAKYEAFQP